MPVLNRVIADRDVKFHVVHDRAFYEALETTNKEFHPFLEYTKYRAVLRQCDIALLPLEDTPFNRMKSDVKFLECAAEEVAVLASETVYGSTLRFHQNDCLLGAIYGPPDSFARILRRMIENAKVRGDMALNAYEYVRDNRMLGQHYRRQYAWCLDLKSRQAQLHSDLLERCPELRVPVVGTSPPCLEAICP
jgi:glycosyltransferase involved in cell wall biosynthesis